ncbi:hypothetical protein B0H14DRAFT_2560676 [Mycena olivaceomarginata]|nr:hypothetical protein B0H14DRAFT_2560676 [Mycena olivaceomarginata]
MSLTSVTLKRQEILARDLRFTSSRTFALKVEFRQVSDSKVKQEGQEEIRKTFGWEFFKINSPICAKSLTQMCGREARKNFRKLAAGKSAMSTDPFLTMTTDSDLAACTSSSDHEIRYQRALREYRTARAEHHKWQDTEEVLRAGNVKLARRLRHDMEEAERIRKAEAVQAQRDKWKAASARYYVKQSEIKEKKRAKMAEKRAARKLAWCRWDPPKAARSRKPDGEGQLDNFSGTPDLDLDLEDGGPRSPGGVSGHLEGRARRGRYGGRRPRYFFCEHIGYHNDGHPVPQETCGAR